MLIDTGAYRTFMTARYVQKLNISTTMTDLKAEGIGGEQNILSARVKEFSIGPTVPIKGNFPVMGEYSSETPYAVILGADFLSQADLLFDLENRFMQFFYPKNCKRDVVIFPEANILEADWLDYDKRLFVTLNVNGTPMRTLIDTGATWSMLDKAAAARAGITASMPNAEATGATAGVGGDRVEAWFVPVAKLEIGKEVLSDIRMRMTNISDGREYENRSDVILGMDFLRNYQVLFARSQKKLYLIKRGPTKLIGSSADWVSMIEDFATKGTPAAKSMLADMLFDGRKVAKDDARANKLMAEAAASGDNSALMHFALEDFVDGKYAKAATTLRKLSAEPSASRDSDLMSYLASAHNGEKDEAVRELKQVRRFAKGLTWPIPVIDYMLNDSDESDLLKFARKQELSAKSRECEAHFFIGHVNWLKGDTGAARRAFDKALATCDADDFEHRASTAALKQIGI